MEVERQDLSVGRGGHRKRASNRSIENHCAPLTPRVPSLDECACVCEVCVLRTGPARDVQLSPHVRGSFKSKCPSS